MPHTAVLGNNTIEISVTRCFTLPSLAPRNPNQPETPQSVFCPRRGSCIGILGECILYVRLAWFSWFESYASGHSGMGASTVTIIGGIWSGSRGRGWTRSIEEDSRVRHGASTTAAAGGIRLTKTTPILQSYIRCVFSSTWTGRSDYQSILCRLSPTIRRFEQP